MESNRYMRLSSFERLNPGFMFQPTDVEIIEAYLKRKIESKVLPPWPVHEVNFCSLKPQLLTGSYQQASDDKWYFISSCLTNTFGDKEYWGESHKSIILNTRGRLVGYRDNFEFIENGQKTGWLMDIYSTLDPSRRNIKSEWMLGKIYYKDSDQDMNNATKASSSSSK